MKKIVSVLLMIFFIFGLAFGEGTIESTETKIEGQIVTPTPEPTPEPTLIPANRSLLIKSSAGNRAFFEEGEEITLTLVLEGFLDTDIINNIHWYRSLNGKEWEEINNHETIYTFKASVETLQYWWKASVDYTATK